MHSTTLPFAVPLPPDVPCAFSLHALAAHLQTVPHRRKRRGRRYPLPVLLAIAVLAKFAGPGRLEPVAHWAKLRAADLAQVWPPAPHHAPPEYLEPRRGRGGRPP
jgi:DDE_Tnp_1-associated